MDGLLNCRDNFYSQNYFYTIPDWLGTNRAIMDATGNVVNAHDHYPFGKRMPARHMVTDAEGNRYQYTSHEFDEETGYGYHGARYYNRELGRYMNVDRFAENFFDQSPYVYAGNQVVNAVDVNGDSVYRFRPDGTFWEVHDDGKTEVTGVWYTKKQDNKDKNGNITSYTYTKPIDFTFSDPSEDTKNLRDGVINRILFVKDGDVASMLKEAGAFNSKNQGYYDAINFLIEEGKGGGDFDFSYSQIPAYYSKKGTKGVSSDPQNSPSSLLFYVNGTGVAQNHMNFGNFLFGAGGQALGVHWPVLLGGAQYNSIKNSDTNNYKPQWDSPDDQLSILKGYQFASKRWYNWVSL